MANGCVRCYANPSIKSHSEIVFHTLWGMYVMETGDIIATKELVHKNENPSWYLERLCERWE